MPNPDTELLERIAANLRVSRERRGLTREQLSETTHVDPQMIKRIEGARANPALVVLSRLASALMISLAVILGGDAAAEPSRAVASEMEPFDSEDVGQTIVSLRRQRNVSRRALAKLIDLNTATLQRYETGESDARVLEVGPIARALAIDSVQLVTHIEQNRRRTEAPGGAWREDAPGVQSRLVSSGGRSQLWEWRFAPGADLGVLPAIGTAEEIATVVRGEIAIEIDDVTEVLRGGGSIALPPGRAKRFVNRSRTTARMLRFSVRG